MKVALVSVLLLILTATNSFSQNKAIAYSISQKVGFSEINLALNDGERIILKTRYKESDFHNISYMTSDNYVLILFLPTERSYSYLVINAAWKNGDEWVQDYQDREYLQLSTGLSCAEITSAQIINSTTVNVTYEIKSYNKDLIDKFDTDLKLGKYGLFQTTSKSLTSLTIYNEASKLGKLQIKSPRENYLLSTQ